MANNPNSKNDKLPLKKSPEDRYLDLWEENIRLIAATGTTAKQQVESD